MVEIEIKARIKDKKLIEDRLAQFLSPGGEVSKDDEYWIASCPDAAKSADFRFRIRSEKSGLTVTYKEKTLNGQTEVNNEVEFLVQNLESFKSFIKRLGARPHYTKSKKGTRWLGEKGLIAEVISLAGIGDFLEVEIMEERAEAAAVANAKRRLYAVLERCELNAFDVEIRPYSQLLGVQ